MIEAIEERALQIGVAVLISKPPSEDRRLRDSDATYREESERLGRALRLTEDLPPRSGVRGNIAKMHAGGTKRPRC